MYLQNNFYHHNTMKKNILIAGILSAISLAAISQASDNPWEYYWAGSSQKKSRS